MSTILDTPLGCLPYRDEPSIVMALCRQCGTCLVTNEEEDEGLCSNCLNNPIPFALTQAGQEAAENLPPVLYAHQTHTYEVTRASFCACGKEIAFGEVFCKACKPLPIALTAKAQGAASCVRCGIANMNGAPSCSDCRPDIFTGRQEA